jgi:Uri superfamily endonuclease
MVGVSPRIRTAKPAGSQPAVVSENGFDVATAGEGTYTLVVALPERAAITVGALGEYAFAAGWYAYTGSAFGPGGFARVDRHRALAAGERDARHWHVDYLLGHDTTAVDAVGLTPGHDIECAVSDALAQVACGEGGQQVAAFGASDCGCESHLAYVPDRDRFLAAVEREHEQLRVLAADCDHAGETD